MAAPSFSGSKKQRVVNGTTLEATTLIFLSSRNLSRSHELPDARRDLSLLAGLGADEEFLQAFGRLGNGLQPPSDRPLNPDCSGLAASREGLATVGVANDHSHHPVHGLDPPDQDTALLRGALMASA